MDTTTFRAFTEPDYDAPVFIDEFTDLTAAKKAVRDVANNAGDTDFGWMEVDSAFFLLGDDDDANHIYSIYKPGFDFDGPVE